MPLRTTARMTALRPGQSPPPVSTQMRHRAVPSQVGFRLVPATALSRRQHIYPPETTFRRQVGTYLGANAPSITLLGSALAPLLVARAPAMLARCRLRSLRSAPRSLRSSSLALLRCSLAV